MFDGFSIEMRGMKGWLKKCEHTDRYKVKVSQCIVPLREKQLRVSFVYAIFCFAVYAFCSQLKTKEYRKLFSILFLYYLWFTKKIDPKIEKKYKDIIIAHNYKNV